MKVTTRQEKLLKSIIEEYNKTSKPVGSKIIVEKYMPEVSPQTIRIEMAKLEDLNFLEKTHTSSGRVPSIEGYKYYDKNILVPVVDKEIINKLKMIFEKRQANAEQVINESLNLINEITGLVSLSSNINQNDENLRQISLVQLDAKQALIILVSSSANISKTLINYFNVQQLKDVEVCIRIFNQYLIGVKFCDIQDKLREIEPIIKKEVLEFEYITQEIIMRLFNYHAQSNENKKIVGVSSIFNNPEFQDHNKLKQIIELIENGTIWDQIKHNLDKTYKNQKIIIEHKDDLPISIATAKLNIKNQSHQISVVGPTRWDLKQIKGILEYITNQLEKIYNNPEDSDDNEYIK